jgi:hypothetical protein
MRFLILTCLIASALSAQVVHRAKLCESASLCAYDATVDFEFAQEGSDAKPEKNKVDVKFTLTSVCSHAESTTFKLDVLSVTRSGESPDEATADAENDELTKHPLYVTQVAADGSLSDVVSPEPETAEAADFKRGLLSTVNFPAAPAVLSGSLSADLEYEFTSVDMHGPHTVKHTARKHANGITLLSTRTYARAMEVPAEGGPVPSESFTGDGPVPSEDGPSLEAQAEAEEQEQHIITTQTGTTKAELTATGETKTLDSNEAIKIPGPAADGQGAVGDYTETVDGVGETSMKLSLDIAKSGTAKAEQVCSAEGQANPTAYLQTVAGPSAQRIAAHAPPRARAAKSNAEAFTAKDLQAATELLAAKEDFTSETSRLALLLGREGAAKAVHTAGLKHYVATKDADAFEKLAAALAMSGRPEGHALAAGLAADEQHPAQLRVRALVALLTTKKADEKILRLVEGLAKGAYAESGSLIPGDDNVPAAANLVLGGLIHMHRRNPSEYVQSLVSAMENSLASGDLSPMDRITHVAALGNAAWPSSSPYIARMTADSQPREVRLAALHAMRRLAFDPLVESSAVAAAKCNDTTVSAEAVRFLQETTGNVVTDLEVGGFTQELTVTFISASQDLTRSSIHYVSLTEGIYYKYGKDSGVSTHKIEASAQLKAGVYSASWTFLSVGVYAEKKTGERSGIYFFVDIMGYNVIKRTIAGGEPNGVKDLQIGGEADLLDDLALDLQDSAAVGATCSGQWSAGIAGDFGYTKQLFDVTKSFWVYVVTIDVQFKGSGRVGVKPGLSVSSCTNARTGGNEVMVMGGMEPYASVTVNLEASINLWLVRGGVGGELKIIEIGFPLYGEKYWTSGDLCGYLDFKFSAMSGRLYLFADWKRFYWKGWHLRSEWKRFGEITLVSWSGWTGTKSIYKNCRNGAATPGVPTPPTPPCSQQGSTYICSLYKRYGYCSWSSIRNYCACTC